MSNKATALQIINFLKSSVSNSEISEDYLESIDVAIDCIADAYEVNKDDDTKTVKDEFNGKTLKEIISEFKVQKSDKASEVPVHVEADEESLKKADELKLEGNKAMARKDFNEAISKYTEAIKLAPRNAVYLSNRAAAYSSLRDHESAVKDAETAIEIDSGYSKAYSRLGLANYALNRPKEALEAYKKGLEKEGDKPSEAMKKGYETAKRRVEESLNVSAPEQSTRDTSGSTNPSAPDSGFPDLSSLLGGAGGAGGAPNFADMLNNPQLMQYAQQMMQNPAALQGLMNNPALRQMAQQFGLGGAGAGAGAGETEGSTGDSDSADNGAPDLSGLLNNPALQNLASSFMNNQGNNQGNNSNH